jgi:GntR family transcriptional regulator, transcriptional repressor for pyruvate dehydrogenase complex
MMRRTMNAFQPVRNGIVSHLIVEQLRHAIVNGTMKPGDRLPPERELTELFQASRISVREALKSLESSGLLIIKHGSGVFVAESTSKPISDSLSLMLRVQKGSLNDLAEARYTFQPPVARLACERATPEDLQKLEENIRETERTADGLAATMLAIDFDCLLAEAAHNPVVESMIKAMTNVWKEWISELSEVSEKLTQGAIRDHKMILKAIREMKPDKAYELMLEHIYRTSLIPQRRPVTHEGIVRNRS